jgi:hypothetical protein
MKSNDDVKLGMADFSMFLMKLVSHTSPQKKKESETNLARLRLEPCDEFVIYNYYLK